jgi:hypothetical protein
VDAPGLTPEERAAYAFAHAAKLDVPRPHRGPTRAPQRTRGRSFSATWRDDAYRVEYNVDGQRHLSVVAKNDLSVQVAGICPSGEDAKFDLESLVGVLRDAEGVLRVGIDNAGIDEEMYWDVHPPEDA